MARHRRKKSRHHKNPRRVRAAKRAYKKSGLYKFNKSRKRGRKHRVKTYHRKHKRGGRRKKHYYRPRKAKAQALRHERRLAKARARMARHAHHVPAASHFTAKAGLTPHQQANLERLRAKAAAARASIAAWGY